MQADDARALRRSAVPTAAVGVLCAVVAGVVAGGKGVLGAALALAVVMFFFAIDYFVLGRAARVGPQALMVAALAGYIVKILIFAVLSASFVNTTLFNGRAFGFTAVVCVLCWSASQVHTWMKAKTFYVEPGKP